MKIRRKFTGLILALLSFLCAVEAFAQLSVDNFQELIASDGALSDQFGISVDVDGNRAVVGARFEDNGGFSNNGAAYVFYNDPTDNPDMGWVEEQRLDIPGGGHNQWFGHTVGIEGDVVIVGAPSLATGTAWVFTRDPGTGLWDAGVALNTGESSERFGWSVAIDNGTIVVGELQDATQGASAGAAHIFELSGSWTPVAKLLPPAGAEQQFGSDVAIDFETIVVGARAALSGNPGAAYAFDKGAGWTNTTAGASELLPSTDVSAGDQYGESVAISGDLAVIGALFDNDITNGDNSGSVTILDRSGGSWVVDEKITASDGATFDNFGDEVTISGSTVGVGAGGTGINQGSFYLFGQTGTGWSEDVNVMATTTDWLGLGIALDGNTLFVGAPEVSGNGKVSTYNVTLNNTSNNNNDVVANLPGTGVKVFENDNTSSSVLHTDTAVAIAVGDVDNSGIDDVIVSFLPFTGPGGTGGTFISRDQGPLVLLDSRLAQMIAVGNFDGVNGDDLLIDFAVDGLTTYFNDTTMAPFAPVSTVSMAVGDMDGNGEDDAVVSVTGVGTVLLPGLSIPSAVLLDSDAADVLEMADVDGNGWDDIVASFATGTGPGGTGGIFIARNQTPLALLTTLVALQITSGDFDGTGQDDVAFNFDGPPGLAIYLNDTSGMILGTVALVAMTSVDVDNSGNDDLVVSVAPAGTAVFKDLTTVEIWDPTPALQLDGGNVDGN